MGGVVVLDDDLLDHDGLHNGLGLGHLLGEVLLDITERWQRGKRRQLEGGCLHGLDHLGNLLDMLHDSLHLLSVYHGAGDGFEAMELNGAGDLEWFKS